MSSADPDFKPETISSATISLLETRLRRIEFLLTGSSTEWGNSRPVDGLLAKPKSSADTVVGRLNKLQSDLQNLRRLRGTAGDIVRDIESLHSKAPDAFAAQLSSTTSSLPDISATSSVVLSHATLYPECASRLSSLQTLQIPSAEQSNKMISLRAPIDVALQKQADLSSEAEDLRLRTAKCLEWWVKVGVVGMGELWQDWEARVNEVEKDIKRIERSNANHDGYV